MKKQHCYDVTTKWTGNIGLGTANYNQYERSHEISVEHKVPIMGSSDSSFRGDKLKYNPEELLVASLSSCHMLWYLHLCSQNGVVVTSYKDQASGKMEENENGSGCFIEVQLNPLVEVIDINMIEKANEIHLKAHEFCFIANSVNFPVLCNPIIQLSSLQ